jgi:hypothetical protein
MVTKEEVCMRPTMQDTDVVKRLHNLRWRRTKEQGNNKRFITEVGKLTDTTLEDYEYYKDRLHKTLGRLTSLDDNIHELLDDSQYDVNV